MEQSLLEFLAELEVLEEWVGKVEGDYATASRKFAVGDTPNYDAVCFHAQQCVEKYLKALLIHAGRTPPKIHDLVELHRLLQPVCPEWDWPVEELRLVSMSAVMSRYPGEFADREEAEVALTICTRLRPRARKLLGLTT